MPSHKGERWGSGGTGEPDLTRPPGQAPCHCRGEGQTMDKNCLNSGETLNTQDKTHFLLKMCVTKTDNLRQLQQ